ncbi:serine/threonine-protein phosphatase 4 regulatory subunit 3A isoform X2 [Selaginella moellendorffii]|uniref:serine/threonine-protein phosphatase 4 regulatory subunit 3A isoform X2 n=1 Tax=Selaginella moellendorffii TaxID=88036 RepID=UPI000D1C3E6D|nr:serine/threonine-protein phosphatase 4 regulatory subunit 3A isoform X2 [Selaginella moellendorffii]|eukprot:XP_024536999.1 serine/threonine-protein phosphatase 4 regulatory subunit 3A isoform X2 [Selaginella moellendorffii]
MDGAVSSARALGSKVMSSSQSNNEAATQLDLNYLQRVKVYRLNDEGRWDDKGTGHVSVEYLERSDALGMVVIDEEDNNTLLVHRISADDIYRRQEETIISWTDPEIATDLALSFQEAMGCGFIWYGLCAWWDSSESLSCREQICNVRRSVVHYTNVGALENGARVTSDELEHSGTSQDDDDVLHDSGSSEIQQLPGVELSSLPQIVKTIAEVAPPDKDRVASLIMKEQSYIPKLMELFRLCEDLENVENLHMIFRIVKGMISLNDKNVFDTIFSDEHVMDVVGALEYDPELSSQQDHRGFLKTQVVFKEAVPIHDVAIVSKIHQTYRIGYVKDVILPRVLDDQTFANMNSMMLANNKAVVSALHSDKTFVSDLFAKLRSPDISQNVRNDLIYFLHEFCNLSKNLLSLHRSELFGSLVEKGIFEVVTMALQSEDLNLRVSGSDILIVILNHDAALLRTFLVQQEGHVLFGLLVKGLLNSSEGGLQAQILEIMRMLLDSEPSEQQPTEKIAYLEMFYEKYIDQLVEVLTSSCPTKVVTEHSKRVPTVEKTQASGEVLGNICELMCFCVLHHGYRMKYYVMRNNVVEKVLRLVRRKEKVLVVAAVRFLRTCVGLKDNFYARYLIKNNLFEPVIQAFLANGNRYNLLNSAVLELLDFIRKSNLKDLLIHIVENYGKKLECVDYVDTVKQLKVKYDQYMDDSTTSNREAPAGPSGIETSSDRFIGPLPSLRKRKDERALDKAEEDYFNEDSDDEEDSAQTSQTITVNGNAVEDAPFRPFCLVDYDDEDDDSLVPSNGKSRPRKSDGSEHWPHAKRRPHLGDFSIHKKLRQDSGGQSELGKQEVDGINRISVEGKPQIGRTTDQQPGNLKGGLDDKRDSTKSSSSKVRDDSVVSRLGAPGRVSAGCKLQIEAKPRIPAASSPEQSSSR